jgi:hypothetical protein
MLSRALMIMSLNDRLRHYLYSTIFGVDFSMIPTRRNEPGS